MYIYIYIKYLILRVSAASAVQAHVFSRVQLLLGVAGPNHFMFEAAELVAIGDKVL